MNSWCLWRKPLCRQSYSFIIDCTVQPIHFANRFYGLFYNQALVKVLKKIFLEAKNCSKCNCILLYRQYPRKTWYFDTKVFQIFFDRKIKLEKLKVTFLGVTKRALSNQAKKSPIKNFAQISNCLHLTLIRISSSFFHSILYIPTKCSLEFLINSVSLFKFICLYQIIFMGIKLIFLLIKFHWSNLNFLPTEFELFTHQIWIFYWHLCIKNWPFFNLLLTVSVLTI